MVLLWISALSWSIWFGGTIYQMLVIVPMWSASPPESVRAFFTGTDYNRTIWHFFGPLWIPVRSLSILALLFCGWNLRAHRKYFIIAAVCAAIGLVFTLVYIYPINAVLFAQAGGNHTGEEIRTMARHWIIADRARLGLMSVGYFALLRALSISLPDSARP